MRHAQPQLEKRTWPSHFLGLVQELSGDHQLNTRVRGARTECWRELVPGGLFVSHNSVCKRGRYHHGFGLALSLDLFAPSLHSPFFIGGRFDPNFDIAMAFMKHMGLTPQDRRERQMSWHSTHEWREGTDDIVRRCTRSAEEHLLPFYLARIRAAAEPLQALFDDIGRSLDLAEDELRQCGTELGTALPDPGLFELTGAAQTGHPRPTAAFSHALVLAQYQAFAALRAELPEIMKRLAVTCRLTSPR